MADDIVTSLREMATDRARYATHYDGCDQSHLECAALHACDEIERLRAALLAVSRRHVAGGSGDTLQVLRGLRWIVESAQCDCVICEIAAAAIAEIERLRAAGDMLADVMVSGTADGWVEAFDAWEATRA